MAAAASGADAIGLVFYSPSSRAVSVVSAKQILRCLPPFLTKVGLFVDAEESAIRQILAELPLDILQFHGDESAEECRCYARPYIKAVKMHASVDLNRVMKKYHDASAILLDTYVEGVAGGTGQVFDWDRLPAEMAMPVILAGGLSPANVAGAIEKVRPYAVDVSGGVEQGRGIKSPEKMKAFIREVDNAQSQD